MESKVYSKVPGRLVRFSKIATGIILAERLANAALQKSKMGCRDWLWFSSVQRKSVFFTESQKKRTLEVSVFLEGRLDSVFECDLEWPGREYLAGQQRDVNSATYTSHVR